MPGTVRRRAEAPDARPLQMSLWTDREVGSRPERAHQPTRAAHVDARFSRRARRVVVPQGAGLPAVERFVARHRDWAERRSKELLESPRQTSANRTPSNCGCWDGTRRSSTCRVARRVEETDGGARLRVHAPEPHRQAREQALVPWLTRMASHELSHRLRPLAAELDLDYGG